MKHHGNVTKINGAEVEPVDIITFGAPCQDLSVAGKRMGLKHSAMGDEETTRSGLFFEAVRIIKEMREATNNEYPKYAVYENVPGAFSSNKGHDFHAVLEALCSVCDDTVSIPEPYDKKRTKLVWNKAGEIVGNNYSIAWRTLDAQYWGVPQRRKRIYLVADFGSQRAGEILFKQEGLRGDMPQGNETGQGASADAVGGVDGSVGAAGVVSKGNGDCFIMPERHMSLSVGGGQAGQGYPCVLHGSVGVECLNPWDCQSKRIYNPDGIYCTLPAMDCGGANNQAVLIPFTLATSQDVSVVQECLGYDMYNQASTGDKTRTLKTPVGGDDLPVVCLQGNGIGRADTAGCDGCGWRENESYTLNTVDRHAVCYQESVGALQARDYKGVGNQYVGEDKLVVERYDARGNGDGETAATVRTACGGDSVKANLAVSIGNGQLNQISMAEQSNTIDCMHDKQAVLTDAKPPRRYIIRRLTPAECARLQGFPDWWGQLAPYDPADAEFWESVRKTHAEINGKAYKPVKDIKKWYNKLHTDSAEYKMWGNGIALPNAEYVLCGIAEHGAKTLGSLFDGSGGFPLAGLLNGIKPVWASEVEPYPIAVTKSRFKEATCEQNASK